MFIVNSSERVKHVLRNRVRNDECRGIILDGTNGVSRLFLSLSLQDTIASLRVALKLLRRYNSFVTARYKSYCPVVIYSAPFHPERLSDSNHAVVERTAVNIYALLSPASRLYPFIGGTLIKERDTFSFFPPALSLPPIHRTCIAL